MKPKADAPSMPEGISNHGEAAPVHVLVQPNAVRFVVPAGQSLLQAALQQSVGFPYGCKQGTCGACKLMLTEGEVIHSEHSNRALSVREEGEGWVLSCCAYPQSDLVLESRQVGQEKALPIKKLPSRVAELERVSSDVMIVRLQMPPNATPAYRAGQYFELSLKDGVRRSYSAANAPHCADSLELHIRRRPGGHFTEHVFTAMTVKDILRVEGPFGGFFLREASDKPIILLATGTGFAPIKAIIEYMQQKAIVRPTTLYWGGRRQADFYMDAWVRARRSEMPHLNYVPVVRAPRPEEPWGGRTGDVHDAVIEDIENLSEIQVYACGSPAMVDAARKAFCEMDRLPYDEFFSDAFIFQTAKAVSDASDIHASARLHPSTAIDSV